MGNTDNNQSKKCRRKIRIRLADPNIPDSYVCEVLDSSVENEEDISKNDESTLDTNGGGVKPKNYFEILMGQTSKKRVCKSNKIYDLFNTKKTEDGNEIIVDVEKDDVTNLSDEEVVFDSSDDESLLVIKNKVKLQTPNENKPTTKLSKSDADIKTKNFFSIFDINKSEISNKKSLGILNYFTKTEISEKKAETPKTQSSLKNDSKSFKKQNGMNKENVKLAPLFCKKEVKVLDAVKQKARLDFLYKGLPTSVKKTERVCENFVYFPVVSHVQQRNDSLYWSVRDVLLPLSNISDEGECNNKKIFRFTINRINNVNQTIANSFVKINKEFICKLKCKYIGLDVVIDGLKEKQDKFLAKATAIKKDKTNFEELNLLYTDKYKPKSSEILGNGIIVKKLRNWLLSWKSFDEELKKLVKSKPKNESSDDDSDDEFLYCGNESYGLKAPENICVVSGPVGCGKTALVYALANELEFGVLELNSSSKRTGKKVFSDLQEATQSHKVHRVNLPQTEPPQKKRGRKKKKTRTPKPAEQKDSKISLILIEDAEIVFEEHDEGFFSAIATLVQTSKRPLIFLTNESNCHYLYNFKNEQFLWLKMEAPSFHNSCAVLDVVSSLEGVNSSKEFIEGLVSENNCDLRKSLLQLQFWHGCQNLSKKQFDLGQFWWGLSKFLYKNDMKHTVRPKTRKRKRFDDLFDSSDDDLETVAKKFKSDTENCVVVSADVSTQKCNTVMGPIGEVLGEAAVIDLLSVSGSLEPVPGIEYKAKDGLSLEENMEEVDWRGECLTAQLTDELVSLSTRVFSKKLKGMENDEREFDFGSPGCDEIRWRISQEKATDELSKILPTTTDKKNLHLDYLPILRNICRTEQNRIKINPKRKNRFYHYLNNLGLEFTDENLDLNCDIFNR